MRRSRAENSSPGISRTIATPSSIVTKIPEWVIIFRFQQLLTILCVSVGLLTSVIGGKFGTVVRWNERLIEISGRRTWGRLKLLWWVGPKRVLALSAEAIGGTVGIQELPVVAEDNVEEESGDEEFDDESKNIRPGGSVPGLVTPYTRKGVNKEHNPPTQETHNPQLRLDPT